MTVRLRRAVMLLAPWMFARAALAPELARRSRAQAQFRRAYLVAYAIAVTLLGFLVPLLLIPIGVAACAATLVAMWCSRRSFGVRRGLPPGRLPLAPVAPIRDQEFYAKQAERLGPVFKTVSPVLPRPTVCVVGLRRGLSVLRDNEQRLGPISISFEPMIPRKLLRHMAPDDHLYYRRLFQRAMRNDVVDSVLPDIDRVMVDGLVRTSDASAAVRPEGVAPRPYLERMVFAALLRLFLGVASTDPAAVEAEALLLTIGQEVGAPRDSPRYREVEEAANACSDLVRLEGLKVASMLEEGLEVPASFLSALIRDRSDALVDPTVVANIVFLLRTGGTDLTGLLHWVVKLLGDNPRWIRRTREAADPEGLSKRVVMETLRLAQSELIFRTVLDEIEVDGRRVPAGWNLRVCVRESHRDPAVFTNPGLSTRIVSSSASTAPNTRPSACSVAPVSGLTRCTLLPGRSCAISPRTISRLLETVPSSSTCTGDPVPPIGSFSCRQPRFERRVESPGTSRRRERANPDDWHKASILNRLRAR